MIKAKLDDRGTVCMFVGYARQHAGDIYQMVNIKTNSVIITRDVSWINKFYHEQQGDPSHRLIYIEMDKTEKEGSEEIPEVKDEEDEKSADESVHSEGTSVNSEELNDMFNETFWKELGKPMPREVKRLKPYNNPGLKEQEERAAERQAHFCFLVNNLKKK